MPISEKLYMQSVIDLSKVVGWRHLHVFDSRRSDSGCARLELVQAAEALGRRTQGPKGRLTSEQGRWLELLSGCGVETHVWHAGVDSLQGISEVLRCAR